jgi:hypothetical protein
VRWERLFADLEAQLEAAQRRELDVEVADRTRRELALTTVTDRLRAAVGGRLELTAAGAGSLAGEVERVGTGWLLLDCSPTLTVLVLADAIVSIRGLPGFSAGAADAVAARMGLGIVLRGLAQDRAAVALTLRDGSAPTGTIDRVGADHLDLAEHPVDQPRRNAAVRGNCTVPFTGLATVRVFDTG